MLKILYAASSNENAKIQLMRFCQAMVGKPYQLKIAAYRSSSPSINIDWSLDCLQNVFRPEHISLDNENFVTYYQQVKYYNPDLIISDLEYFTSYIANELNITLWQCSSSLIAFALTNEYKYNLGLFKKYAYLFGKNEVYIQRLINIIDNSNCNFVYSHFGDTDRPPPLKNDYTWIRPYYILGKVSIPCQHNVVASVTHSNKEIIHLLKQHQDSVYFTEFLDEYYGNPVLKNIANVEELACNLKNSNLFLCQGQTSWLADAFYNGKFSAVFPNLKDTECVTNSFISEKLGLSANIYQSNFDLLSLSNRTINPTLNEKIVFLHEMIEAI
jgi:hypothetical protein